MSEKTLTEKLFLKPGKKLMLINPPQDLSGLLPAPDVLPPEKGDVLLAFIQTMSGLLEMLPKLNSLVNPGGIIWIAYPKLTSRQKSDVNRDSINTQAKLAGWTGVAIIAIDETWSALRIRPL